MAEKHISVSESCYVQFITHEYTRATAQPKSTCGWIGKKKISTFNNQEPGSIFNIIIFNVI